MARNDVKHDQILPEQGDFYKPGTSETCACDEWGISRMYSLKVFHNKSNAIGAKEEGETSSLPARKALGGHNFSGSPNVI